MIPHQTIRILIVDDHAMFRGGLGLIIEAALPNSLVWEAATLEEALRCPADVLDIVLLDILLTGLSGLEGLALLKQRWPLTQVLMLSSQDDLQVQRTALERGASGFVSKAESPQAIVQAILQAAQGELRNGLSLAYGAARLTPRQCQVLDLLSLGLSNKHIAQKMSLSHNTVRRHVQDILAFLNVSSRTEAAFEARRQGLIG